MDKHYGCKLLFRSSTVYSVAFRTTEASRTSLRIRLFHSAPVFFNGVSVEMLYYKPFTSQNECDTQTNQVAQSIIVSKNR